MESEDVEMVDKLQNDACLTDEPTIAESCPGAPQRRLPVLRQARPTVAILFFFSAVGCSIGWTAVLSNLVYYSHVLGMNSYLYLNVAVYVPWFPVTLAQARWDSHFDRQYESLRSFSFRGLVGFLVTAIAVTWVPFASHNLVALVILCTLMGTASAALYGMLKQMASFIYPNCGRLPAAVASGMQASAVFVLAVSLATGFGSSGDSDGLVAFYISVTVLVFLCWACFCALMSRSRDVEDSMLRRDSSFRSERLDEPLVDSDNPEEQSDVEMDYGSLWKKTWCCYISVMVTVASSVAIASWFNRVKSSDPSNMSLPQVLFYTRLFADLLGRPATLALRPLPARCLLVAATLRLLFVPFFFVYTTTNFIPRNDLLITAGVAGFAFSSGYLVTRSYQLAPTLLTEEQQNSTSKQAGLMNVCFSGSLLFGLMASFALLGSGIT